MIAAVKTLIKRFWPVMRLRTIIFGTLLFVAALPGISAIGLRVYENTLVRQTEAELIAQGAALVAATEARWPGSKMLSDLPPPQPKDGWLSKGKYSRSAKALPSRSFSSLSGQEENYRREPTTIDLSSTRVLAARAAGVQAGSADKIAQRVASEMTPVMLSTSRRTLASIQMIDQNGIVVAGFERGRSYAHIEEARSALAGQINTKLRRNGDYNPRYSFEWLSRASGLRLHHARPLRINGEIRGALLITRSPRVLFEGIYQDIGKIALGIAVIFAILIGITAIMARAIIRPIESLSRATRMMTAGRGRIPARPGLGVVEIRDLYDDYRSMAEAITRRSHYLRDFAASVSHEFKTPLTGIRGAIELLEDHGEQMSAEERQRFYDNMTGDADRLSALVGRLMELAKADMQITDADAKADVAEVIAGIADGFRSDDFTVLQQTSPALPPALAPPATIEAVTTTMLENSQQAGASQISIAAYADQGRIIVDYHDNGPGIADGDRDRIFDAFFTSKRGEGGTGLGLAIARSLVEASNGELIFVPSDEGAHFRLVLQAS
ncbi:ATP-binding protein [Sphingorhabdus arenilitoris]|uniref:histidine kinase n=1 Tax=Sphingorhabdus arenilitoris TaxID=1490041 RepID=A0ABV8RDT5_9SPHN